MRDKKISESIGDVLLRVLSREMEGISGVVVWPRSTVDIPDDSMLFRVAYLPPEYAGLDREEVLRRLDAVHRFWGPTRRQFRNALAFVIPDAGAIERLGALSGEASEPGTGSHPLNSIYRSLALPRKGEGHGGNTEFDFIALSDEAGPNGGLHSAVLGALDPYLWDVLEPDEVIRIIGLGLTDCAAVHRVLFPLADVARWIFSFLTLPRLRNIQPIQRAISKGVREGKFGLLHTPRLLELDFLPEDLKPAVLLGTDIEPGSIQFSGEAYLVWPGAMTGPVSETLARAVTEFKG